MTNLLTGYLEDRSTAQYFCFSISCEVCGEFWYSSSVPFSKAGQAAEHREKRELYDAVYQREKNRARLAAGREAVERFSQCPICRRLPDFSSRGCRGLRLGPEPLPVGVHTSGSGGQPLCGAGPGKCRRLL